MERYTRPACSEDHIERQSARYRVSLPVRLRPDGLRMVTVSVGDISVTGFMAETDEPVALGAHVSIDLPGLGPMAARIRWTVGVRIGARFAAPIDVHKVRAEMMRLAAAD